MGIHILPPITDREPELYERDIDWGRSGMSVDELEPDDLVDDANFRELAIEAIHMLARLTTQLDRANTIIVALHEENRALRLRLAT